MVRLAIEKYGAEWVINGDADEFFYAKTGISKMDCPLMLDPISYFAAGIRPCQGQASDGRI